MSMAPSEIYTCDVMSNIHRARWPWDKSLEGNCELFYFIISSDHISVSDSIGVINRKIQNMQTGKVGWWNDKN